MESSAPSTKCHFCVILVHGKAGSGKNTITDMIADYMSTGDKDALQEFGSLISKLQFQKEAAFYIPRTMAFADTLKEHMFANGEMTEEELTAASKSKELRYKLINTGDSLRATHGVLYFAKTLWAKMQLDNFYDGTALYIVPDLRELHELEFFKQHMPADRLKLITVHAPKRVEQSLERQVSGDEVARAVQSSHSTETGLDRLTCDRETAELNGFIFIDNDM